MRRFAPSKILLLHAVMRDDNMANNGEVLIITDLLITFVVSVHKQKYNSNVKLLEDRKLIKIIPWEVDHKLS